MTDLIARIEAAQPSEARELFHEAFSAAMGDEPQSGYNPRGWKVGEPEFSPEWLGYIRMKNRLDLLLKSSAYRDAAAMFVPEGEGHWPQVSTISTNPNNPSQQKERVEIWMKNGGKPFRGHATTPYFALLAAAMKARQTDERD